ncbi:unnamed protein product [Lepeophtheirus salmonis]|uniref:(salmon louse) hypothetical protein n=1 Tax=Lepeophtheirus salmonis TaxID=72036 RepID=A0A7R8D4L7_LEPSM|nr:unnamed protein product [Lepeophtheirus salmonis]CAF3026834.1 unnamed protein product [Lepeophtheirus salmonis]
MYPSFLGEWFRSHHLHYMENVKDSLHESWIDKKNPVCTSEFDFLGELRSQRDTVKIMDIEWAASDRPVISTADGCIKILTENLQSSTSPVDVYRLKTFSPSLLPNSSKRADFKVSIHHQPWKTKFSFHYSDSLKIQFDLLDPDLKKGLLNSNSQLERSYLASCESSVCLGESLWERDFWTVANAQKTQISFNKDNRQIQKRNTIDTLLCLVENPDDVVRSLLEIDPSDPSYYVDNLKACLVLSLKDSFSTSTQSTIKLVATNLISEGKIWEGVNLLCLIGKIFDACKYLQSYNEWEASLWLGQSRLEYEEFKQLALKYCDHCLTSHRRRRALLMYMKLKEYVMVLDVLYSGKMIPLAAKFLQVLEERECLPDSSHALVLTEEISLAYARYLFDIKNIDAAYYYCDKADEKGEILRREFDVLLSKNT